MPRLAQGPSDLSTCCDQSDLFHELADVRDQMDLVWHYLPEAGTVHVVALHKYLVSE